MANERKTENIVRKHFSKFEKGCLIEEQKSDNPKIDKLLKNASKKGNGAGYPEFIISFSDYPDFLIVVECKANPSKHESGTRDKYADYAVDGSLLYSSFLSKEFDVLSIAVSGENKEELKISHYLQLISEHKAKEIFGNILLDLKSYLKGYLQTPQKVNQDYDKLLDFSRHLNEELHLHKIAESKRCLLISGVLIALENKAFKRSYADNEPEDLAETLVDTVTRELKKANIHDKKLDNLRIQYSFIKTEASLANKKHVLRDLIKSIDENINDFKKTHEFYDFLGQLYIEFLRYANSDKGLGIVLTPPHITELFADLAAVNKDSVVYDNCAGTGGFLISAMSKMVKDTQGNLKAIEKIKEKQLIGVEYSSSIFALACSNMYIHQDGKSNMIHGDCFDEKVIEKVKKFNPTVGFLNPPYKSDKKRDPEKLAFVLNNSN
ncbi:MAG: N-6 DNA methylase [Phycisphaerae bacterium]|nr:N-6 DNA methylase [Phycisphaerae bacterium]